MGAVGDCERIGEGLLAQPVNALSSLAYLLAGASLLAGRRAAFGAATAANGIGGLAWHGGWWGGRFLHDAAILATLGMMAAGDRPGRRAAVVAGAGAALAAHPAVSGVAQALLWPVAAVVAGRRSPRLLAAAAVAVAVHAASRTGGPLCRPDSLLQGHAAWHVGSALLLWWWGRTTP